MDRYQFEDAISAYLDNELGLPERKMFESYMEANPDMKELVTSMSRTLASMKNLPSVSTSQNFMSSLQRRIDFEKSRPSRKSLGSRSKSLFGFTPLYAGLMSVLVVAFVFVGMELMPDKPSLSPNQKPEFTSSGLQSLSPVTPDNPAPASSNIFAEAEPDSTDSLDIIQPKRFNLENKISLVKDQR